MTRGAAAIPALLMMLGMADPVFARQPNSADQFSLGRAAMAAHDPAAAIRHFEQTETREGREWLAIALMMESRSPSDRFVERAFETAMHARTEAVSPAPARAELAAALRSKEMVIAFLIGESSAYAWAFDHDAFVGYQLPAPAEISTAAARARAYIDGGDRDGVERIAEELMPALLGPALERLPKLRRLIFVLDGPLRDLPIGTLPAGEGHAPLQQQVAVSVVEPAALLDSIRAESSPPSSDESWQQRTIVIAAVAVAILLAAGIAVVSKR